MYCMCSLRPLSALPLHSLALLPGNLPNLQVTVIADHGLLSRQWWNLVLVQQEPQILSRTQERKL